MVTIPREGGHVGVDDGNGVITEDPDHEYSIRHRRQMNHIGKLQTNFSMPLCARLGGRCDGMKCKAEGETAEDGSSWRLGHLLLCWSGMAAGFGEKLPAPKTRT